MPKLIWKNGKINWKEVKKMKLIGEALDRHHEKQIIEQLFLSNKEVNNV